MTELSGPQKEGSVHKLLPFGANQKLTYLPLDLMHSSLGLSRGNLTLPHVLWMHLLSVGRHCIFNAFRPFCQIHRRLQKIIEEKVPQGIMIYHCGPLKSGGHNF